MNKTEVNSMDLFYKFIESNVNVPALKEFVSSSETPELKEIGDGNMNNVFRITNSRGSLIIKQSLPYIRLLGPEFSLSIDRIKYEYMCLKKYFMICPESVPAPYVFSKESYAIIMEDLHGYEILRSQIIKGIINVQPLDDLIKKICLIHTSTSEKKLKERFAVEDEEFRTNPLINLHVDYAFKNPYIRDHVTNKFHPDLTTTRDRLLDSQPVLDRVECLKNIFLQKKECLIHGDLHTGSVMVNDNAAKMIDFEFAFFGPRSVDLGFLIGSYLIALHSHSLSHDSSKKHKEAAHILYGLLSSHVNLYMELCNINSQKERKQFLFELAGFTGIEIVKRTIGAPHVEDLEGNPKAELASLESALRLLTANPDALDTTGHLVRVMLNLEYVPSKIKS